MYSGAEQARRYRRCGSFPRALEDLVREVNSSLKRSSFSAASNARSKVGFSSPNARQSRAVSEYGRLADTVRGDLNDAIDAKSRRTLSQVSRLVKKNDWRTKKMKDEAEHRLTVYKTLAFPE